MKRTQLYLAGPMTGLPEFNYPAFIEAAARLRDAGFEVFSPAENGLSPAAPWNEHMRVDIAHLVSHCYGVATLPGWGNSKGATLEVDIATRLDMPVHPFDYYWLAKARTVVKPSFAERVLDRSIADGYISLEETADGGMTNAMTFQVRPGRLVPDESGEHGGESFLEVRLTREEMRECLADLDKDWADHEKFAKGLPA